MPKNPELAWSELHRRWQKIFMDLNDGGEVSPSRSLRTEGVMEAVLLFGFATEVEIQDALERCYRESTGEDLREDWRDLFPFPQLPGFGQRAPVYPSTRD